MIEGHNLNSVRLWAGMTAGSDHEVSLSTDADGGLCLTFMAGEVSISLPMKPSQVHEVLSRRAVTLQGEGCGVEFGTKAGMLEVDFTGLIDASFSMPLDRFGLLAKSLGLSPPNY